MGEESHSPKIKMSDREESPVAEVPEAEEVEVSGDAASKGQLSFLDALKGVLKLALMHDGLSPGLREASKALDRRQAHVCVLNESCEEDAYKKLVIALCSEHKIPLIKVPDGKQLGEWAGLCVLDREEMHARLSTAPALPSRIGVRSLKSDRSSSTTSTPSSKVTKRMDGVSFSMGRHSAMLGVSLRCTLDMMHTGQSIA